MVVFQPSPSFSFFLRCFLVCALVLLVFHFISSLSFPPSFSVLLCSTLAYFISHHFICQLHFSRGFSGITCLIINVLQTLLPLPLSHSTSSFFTLTSSRNCSCIFGLAAGGGNGGSCSVEFLAFCKRFFLLACCILIKSGNSNLQLISRGKVQQKFAVKWKYDKAGMILFMTNLWHQNVTRNLIKIILTVKIKRRL